MGLTVAEFLHRRRRAPRSRRGPFVRTPAYPVVSTLLCLCPFSGDGPGESHWSGVTPSLRFRGQDEDGSFPEVEVAQEVPL